ncbi:hypothetical protein BP6252_07211 [Coleophoma cylindrospora]|uniref:Telomere replication protein EST3 n=1 Tax=Coleophoma cylindrospora TaxID=1849047 RepID=A0A3D8RHD5_9HELO|nr:hypothetical protein BP6252_07211 [Coleophoma cylindrospora]
MSRGFESQMSNLARPDNIVSQGEAHSQNDISTQLPMKAQILPQSNIPFGVPITAAKNSLLSILSNSKVRKSAATINELAISNSASTTSVLQPMTRSEIEERTSRLGSKANSRSSQQSSLDNSQSQDFGQVSPEKVLDETSKPGLPPLRQLLDDGDQENSQDFPSQYKAVDSNSKPSPSTAEGGVCVQPEHLPTQMPVVDLCSDLDTFLGLPRMRRKYVRVSKEQQDLLSHMSSWVTSKHAPVHNVPAEVQKSTSHFIDQMMARTSKSSEESPTPVEQGRPLEARQRSQERTTAMSQTDSEDSGEEKLPAHTFSIGGKRRHRQEGSILVSSPPASLPAIDTSWREAGGEQGSSDGESSIPWSSSPIRGAPPFKAALSTTKMSERAIAQEKTEEQNCDAPQDSATIDGRMIAAQGSICSPTMHSAPISPSIEPRKVPKPVLYEPLLNQIPLSSQPSDDDEIELGIPRTINEPDEGSDGEILDNYRHSVPSTALPQHHDNILVERTPQADLGIFRELSADSKSQRRTGHESRAAMREPSSDPIIPCTFMDDDQPEGTKFCEYTQIQLQEVPLSPFGAANCQVQEEHTTLDTSSLNKPLEISDEKERFCVVQNTKDHESLPPTNMTPPSGPNIAGIADNALPQSHDLQSSKRAKVLDAESLKRPPKRRRRLIQSAFSATSSEDDSRDLSKTLSARIREHRIKVLAAKKPSTTSERSSSPEHLPGPSALRAQNHLTTKLADDLARENESTKAKSCLNTVSSTVSLQPTVRSNDEDIIEEDPDNGTQSVRTVLETADMPTPILATDVQVIECGSKPSSSVSIFSTYKNTYPELDIGQRTFIKACVYIEWLVEQKKQPHPFLWDDFIRVYSTDYVKYVERIAKGIKDFEKSKAMTGLDYYNNEIESPILVKGILNPENLQEALNNAPKDAAKFRSMFYGKHDAQLSRRSSRALEDDTSESFHESLSELQAEASFTAQPPTLSASGDTPLDQQPKVVPKKRFFETHSQVATLAAERTSSKAIASKPPANENQLKTKRQRRSLPWSSAQSPEGSSGGGVDLLMQTRKPVISEHHEPLKGSEIGPPILDINAQQELSSPLRCTSKPGDSHARSKETRSLSRGRSIPKSRNTPYKDLHSPHSRSGPLDPVRGWILDQIGPVASNVGSMRPPSSAQRKYSSTQELLDMDKAIDFVPRRKRLSGISSTTSTPTPNRATFAPMGTNAAAGAEPETQAWQA